MALINCPECGQEVSDQAAACPKCAHPLKAADSGPVRHVPPVVQKKGRGCFSWIGIGAAVIVGIGVIALIAKPPGTSQTTSVSGTVAPAQPKAQDAAKEKPAAVPPTPVPSVGQTLQQGGWEVTLLDFGPYGRFAATKPATAAQGKLMVADMRIKNLQSSTSNFSTNDFELKSGDGRAFKPAGQTGTIERGFFLAQTVQPGLTTENRVVFDIDPSAQGLSFTALRITFSVPNP